MIAEKGRGFELFLSQKIENNSIDYRILIDISNVAPHWSEWIFNLFKFNKKKRSERIYK